MSAFAARPLHSREEFMATFIQVANELDMPDKRGAAVCAGMCAFQEAGADPWKEGIRHIWTPGNQADPCYAANPDAYPHDSEGDDGKSTGPFQQQMGTNWGWGGNLGDPEGTRKRMDMYESTKLFMGHPSSGLKAKGYNASNAQTANDSIQRVQGSSFPNAYTQWWDEANRLYDQVIRNIPENPDSSTPGGNTVGFTGDPVWLEDVLREALGERLVVAQADWKERGTGGQMGDIWGVLIHHTGNDRETVAGIRDGRPDLAGPLSQCLITPDGKCHLIAVGPCNHAGIGSYPEVGTNNGNQRLIGFECAWPTIRADGSYDPGQRWPDAQIITMRDATAAVLKKLGYDSAHCIGHKEWATKPPNVKWDPGNIDMPWFRGEVQKDLDGFIFPGEHPPVVDPPATSPISIPPDYDQNTYLQINGRWEMLGWQTPVETLAELRDAITGSKDAGKAGFKLGAKP